MDVKTEHNIRLTAAELASLWTTYMVNSMATCVLNYFANKVEDTEIMPVIEYGLTLAKKHTGRVAEIFNHENVPIPHGFTESDANVRAPRLFDDSFILNYMHHAAQSGIASYGASYPLMVRADVHDLIRECLASAMELEDQARKVMLSKGIYVRPPYISIPKKVDFVQKQSFLTGWFGDRRPLLSSEITHLYSNIRNNALGKALIMGFSQVAQSAEVRDYFVRGRNVASKQIEIFSSILNEEHIPAPMTWDHTVTDSTVPPFTDKLMLFHINGLIGMGAANYGASLATSTRRDLSAHYTRLMTEIMAYAEDGANIMIDKGWMEQPPQAEDRDQLAGNKK